MATESKDKSGPQIGGRGGSSKSLLYQYLNNRYGQRDYEKGWGQTLGRKVEE